MNYYDLEVWKKSRELANNAYSITKDFPKEEVFGLTSQLRRSAVSIPSNIAEGCGRSTPKDTAHFLFIARGSLFELETQIFISFDQNYINQTTCDKMIIDITECKKLLNGFINYHQTLKPKQL